MEGREAAMCAAGAARQEKARENKAKERQPRNPDAIFPLETLPGHIDCRVLSLGARVQ
jgi:hypothetical protein